MSLFPGGSLEYNPKDLAGESHVKEKKMLTKYPWCVVRPGDGAVLAASPGEAAARHTACALSPLDGSWQAEVRYTRSRKRR
jgi:hypothetical protein